MASNSNVSTSHIKCSCQHQQRIYAANSYPFGQNPGDFELAIVELSAPRPYCIEHGMDCAIKYQHQQEESLYYIAHPPIIGVPKEADEYEPRECSIDCTLIHSETPDLEHKDEHRTHPALVVTS